MWMIRWCLCDNTAATEPWASVESVGFLGKAQVARWDTLVCMENKLLHHCAGVFARVYVHFLRLGWHVLNRCLKQQCMCRYVGYTHAFWHQFTYLHTHPLQRVYMHLYSAHVYTICWFASGNECGGFQLVYAEHLSLSVGSCFSQKERQGRCLVCCLFLTQVGVYVCVSFKTSLN